MTESVQQYEAAPIAAIDQPADIATRQSAVQQLMVLAMQNGDLDKLEKAMDLQERYERREAEKRFNEAMAQFKANPPQIIKDAHVKFQTSKGVTEYNHATLGNVCSAVSDALSTHGMSFRWDTEQDGNNIKVSCILSHIDGHSVRTSLSSQSETSGTKNPIQAVASAVTYLKRYTLLTITGVAEFDRDDDGRAGGGSTVDTIEQWQVENIRQLCDDKGVKHDLLDKYVCERWKIERLEDLPAPAFDEVVATIQRRGTKGGAK